MTFIVMFFITVAASVVQTILPAFATLGNAKCPLLLGVVVYYSLNRPSTISLSAAFLAGFLHDALSAVPLGYSSFCFCVMAWAISRFRETVLTEAVVTQAFFGAVSALSVSLLLYTLLTAGGFMALSIRGGLLHAVGSGVLGALTAPVVCRLTGSLDCQVGNVRSVEVEVDIGGLGRTTR